MDNKIEICNVYLIDEVSQKVLLIFKSSGSKKYYAPGGKIDLGETIEDAAKREFFEETNLKLTDCEYCCLNTHYLPNKEVKIHSFLATKYEGQLVKKHNEGFIDWYAFDQVENLIMLHGDKTILNDIINKKTKREYEFYYE